MTMPCRPQPLQSWTNGGSARSGSCLAANPVCTLVSNWASWTKFTSTATPLFCLNSSYMAGRSDQRVLSVGKKLQYCSVWPPAPLAGAAAAGVLAAPAAGLVSAGLVSAGLVSAAGFGAAVGGAAAPPQAAT